jgi:8-oxo-dGTP pyrophosphatase MutT (NUDIX family)
MAYFDHILACNKHDLSRFRPFVVDGIEVGRVRHDVAHRLAQYPEVFRVTRDAVSLHPLLSSPDDRTEAVGAVAADLNREWGTPALRGEMYRVVPQFGAVPVMSVDRGVVSLFGVRAFGVHVNGFVRGAEADSLWVGRRAANKTVAPGALDNMVAGGQPSGLTLFENLLKEAAEEADIPAALAATARPVGAIAYCLEDEWGLKPDVMYCFDLEVPADFVPRNTDGEIEDFTLIPVAEVARLVRDTNQFKFNVNLVIIDFLIRHGYLSPDTEPAYLDLIAGLRRGIG